MEYNIEKTKKWFKEKTGFDLDVIVYDDYIDVVFSNRNLHDESIFEIHKYDDTVCFMTREGEVDMRNYFTHREEVCFSEYKPCTIREFVEKIKRGEYIC